MASTTIRTGRAPARWLEALRPLARVDPLTLIPVTAAAVIALNIPHELAHWAGFRMEGIASCVYFNSTAPAGGLQADSRYFTGLFAGPMANLAMGGLLFGVVLAWRRAGPVLSVIIAAAWLIRVLQVIVGIAMPGSSPVGDEQWMQQILAPSYGTVGAWAIVIVPSLLSIAGLVSLWHIVWREKCTFWHFLSQSLAGIAIGVLIALQLNAHYGHVALFGSC